ncbi:putative F-box protein At4g09190 [Cicer arietinum]|uniref:putative F-box protein At4g09190 n=1 Tax=Cicer arietinum TaxID=3827 RepID=UPI00032AB87A
MVSLPHDVLLEISSWLPAKAIYKFSSTSKFFSNFPRDKYFALKQTQNSLSKIDTCLFFQPYLTQRYNDNIAELHHLSGEDHSSGVSKVFINFLPNSAKILSSANGLILFRSTSDNKDQLFISNPATQTLFPIPIPDQLYTSVDADLKISHVESNKLKGFVYGAMPRWKFIDQKTAYHHQRTLTQTIILKIICFKN